jgi:putative ABC transport system permease protein
MLRRNWSAGELRVLLLALVIAVASVTTVGFFADRVQAALDAQANELLGGDLAVITDHPTRPRSWSWHAAALAIAQTRTFPSMVLAGGNVNLAEIKAATRAFRCAGAARDRRHRRARSRDRGRARAGHGVDRAAARGALGLKVGDTLNVGRAPLRVATSSRASPTACSTTSASRRACS